MTNPNFSSDHREIAGALPPELASAFGQSIANAFTTRYGHAYRTGEVLPQEELAAWSTLASLADADEFSVVQRKIAELQSPESAI